MGPSDYNQLERHTIDRPGGRASPPLCIGSREAMNALENLIKLGETMASIKSWLLTRVVAVDTFDESSKDKQQNFCET